MRRISESIPEHNMKISNGKGILLMERGVRNPRGGLNK